MKRCLALIIIGFFVVTIAACTKNDSPAPISSSTLTFVTLPTATAMPPVAAWVNDTPVFQQTVDRRISDIHHGTVATGIQTVSAEDVLTGMVDQLLMAQIATETPGMVLPATSITEEVLAVEASVPAEQLTAWLTTNHMSATDFRSTVRAELIAQRLFETVTQSVPATAPQIHALCVRAEDPATAENIAAQLEQGVTFANFSARACTDTARKHGADLGWFPENAGVLPSKVEAWAFSLPVNSTEIFSTTNDSYVLHISATDENRALTPEYHYRLKIAYFENWFNQQRTLAKIERIAN